MSSRERCEIEEYFFKKLEQDIRKYSTTQEEEYNIALSAACYFLREIGKLKENLETHNSRMVELGIPEMQISNEKKGGKGLLNKLEDLCDFEVIKKLDLQSKKILLAFYSNRITKEVEDLMISIFICSKVGESQELSNLSDEELKQLILESRYLYTVWKRNIKRSQEEYNKKVSVKSVQELKRGYIERFTTMDENVFYQEINKEDFEKYFGQNALTEDKEIMGHYVGVLNNLYLSKTYAMETLIFSILTNSKNVKVNNWGYIPETNKRGKNTIELQAENILIGIDFPRYNMPVRLHINRERLLSIVSQTLGDTKIPVYKGHEDFSSVKLNGRRRYMGTQILMPIQKEQRKALENAVEKQKDNPNYNCIAHLNWLAYPNRIPEHLKGEPTKEVDLATGAISLVGVDVGDTDGR